jgi:hypothetical protein
MTAPHPAVTRPAPGLGLLWFGLFGAAAAWSVQELVSYAVIAHSCYPDWQPRTVPTVSGTWTIALLVGLVMLAVGVTGTLTAWRASQRTQQRPHFMAAAGLGVSGLMLYTILLNLIALFMVSPCG